MVLGKIKADFGPKLQILKWRSGPCGARSRPPTLSCVLILCVVVPHTHRYHPPKFWPNPKHRDGAVIFPHLARACCLLACCLLLAACCLLAKPSGSTPDTKEGHKTKTGSTSSVTLRDLVDACVGFSTSVCTGAGPFSEFEPFASVYAGDDPFFGSDVEPSTFVWDHKWLKNTSKPWF